MFDILCINKYDVLNYGCKMSYSIGMNPAEASECRWVAFEDLKKEMLDHPDRFSSWFVIAAPHVMQVLQSAKGQNQ